MDVVTKSKKKKLEDASCCEEVRTRARGEGAGSNDMISCLPDDILYDIITILPAKDSARTQILSRRWRPVWHSAPLSRRWRPVWHSAPLNLEAVVACCKMDLHVAAILSKLRTHKGPVHRISLTWLCNDSHFHMVDFDSIFGSPRLQNLQEFELFFQYNVCTYLPVPQHVLRWLPSLRVLSICAVGEVLNFPMESACSYNFPHLKKLTLKGVNISEGTLHGMLSRCPILESLVLDWNIGYRRLHISSATLRSLGVSDAWNCKEGKLEEVIIEYAPLLERLIPRPPKCNSLVIRVIQAPKLKTMGYLSSRISTFMLGTMIFQKMILISHPNVTRTVKILALNTAPSLNVVIDFLKCFPCVEKLYIMAFIHGNIKNIPSYVSLECLDLHLKMLEFINYQGNMSDVNFIKFFLLNARVLESMKFVSLRDKCDEEWVQGQHMMLQQNARASQGLTFDFQADYTSSTLVHMKHISDLTADDPFDRSLCKCDAEGFL